MAKGNLFLGMGRGSVGDVTFYRADGQQLSRARNRKPRNPKSNAQLIQRAISATIVQAYKAGSVIFDHSFEGKAVPSGSQRAFLSVNMRKLREQVLSELNSPALNSASRVVAPRSVWPVPNSYRIAEGSLIQNLFTIVDSGNVLCAKIVDAAQDETVKDFLSRLGITAGEIFTICTFGALQGTNADLVNTQCLFGFMRLTVKETAMSLTTPVSSALMTDVFSIDSSGANLPASHTFASEIAISDIDMAGAEIGAMGVIRSNENSGLRSNCDMVTIQDCGAGSMNDYGVLPSNLLTAWAQDSGAVDSELILEGGQV